MLTRISRLSGGFRAFSAAAPARSNIGKQPIKLLQSVECATEDIPYEFCKSFTRGKDIISLNKQITIKGPKGVLKTAVPAFVNVEVHDGLVSVSVADPSDKVQRSMWGTTRAMIQNNVIGLSEGHLAIVKFVGTGYRALLEKDEAGNTVVSLKIGFPYTPKLAVPAGLSVTSPNPTRLLIEGTDKQQVKLFAARIREFKKPEPYKGKGIYVDDETIKLKEKKVK